MLPTYDDEDSLDQWLQEADYCLGPCEEKAAHERWEHARCKTCGKAHQFRHSTLEVSGTCLAASHCDPEEVELLEIERNVSHYED